MIHPSIHSLGSSSCWWRWSPGAGTYPSMLWITGREHNDSAAAILWEVWRFQLTWTARLRIVGGKQNKRRKPTQEQNRQLAALKQWQGSKQRGRLLPFRRKSGTIRNPRVSRRKLTMRRRADLLLIKYASNYQVLFVQSSRDGGGGDRPVSVTIKWPSHCFRLSMPPPKPISPQSQLGTLVAPS